MILSTVEIKQRSTTSRWIYFITRDTTEHRDAKTSPNRLGFYHYPTSVSDEEAFNKLKDYLLKAQDDKIKQLQKSRDELKALTFKS